MAGRISFSVIVSGNKVGRAFIKPFHAQAHHPLPGHMMSPWLERASRWFIQYLELSPTSWRGLEEEQRDHIITWSDAAGESRWVAAVVFFQGRWFWTRIMTPDAMWSQLLERGDNQIGFQEMLGVLLTWATFGHLLKGSLWTSYGNNDGVLHAIANGGGGASETHACVGQLWLEVAAANTSLFVARVESKANIADAPTRDTFHHLSELEAQFVEHVLPSWLMQLWTVFAEL